MSRSIRYQPEEWSVFFVTGRCIHSRFLLRPSQRVNALIVGVLARALERFDVTLFGMCFLSNHYHPKKVPHEFFALPKKVPHEFFAQHFS